ncbi:MAG: tRNA (guanosine(37)-N1)-methyltransferase TrmD [Actinobacteria bacterium]|nr:tRNA (guanosine(37)-N1)-methyltransferase TrmD [Actinomycetota bacterium]MCL5444631.1 tRNA (guanosine(37)-N1)-methyltransferase TrmD [Actinomycetota bacterium]
MRVDVFTIFPALVDDFTRLSLLGKARKDGALDLRVHDLRDGAGGPHRSVDDAPFGGGPGMVFMPEPIFAAVEGVQEREGLPRPFFLLSPGGRTFNQEIAEELANSTSGFSLLCGRYEGVDQRVCDHLVDGVLSVGDYVLSGGEVAALAVIEAVSRLLPGVMGNDESSGVESFSDGLLEYPQYTRPAEFRGWTVPSILLSGDHQRVDRWRRVESLVRTLRHRPDLVDARGGLTREEVEMLVEEGEVELLAERGYT